MSIWFIAIIVFSYIFGRLLRFVFDIMLTRIVFLLFFKGKKHLDEKILKEMFEKIMENRRQKWYFKTYLGSLVFFIGGGGLLQYINTELYIATHQWVVDYNLKVDNGLPLCMQIVGVIASTIVYLAILYSNKVKYKNEILSSAAKVINEQFMFEPTQGWFKEKSELNIKNLGNKFNLT